MTTARDVAERAGTSTAVVSYVFNNGPRNVSPATRQRVLDAASALGYRPNVLARALSAGRTDSIGLVVPDICNPYFAELARAIEDSISDSGRLLLIGDSAMSRTQEERHCGSFIDRKIDALVLVSLNNEPDIEPFRAAHIPVIALHPLDDQSYASTLTIDFHHAAQDVTTHLIGHGYDSIAILLGTTDSAGGRQHLAGYRHAIAEAGIDERVLRCEISRYDASVTARQWLTAADRPRAIYCTTDEQAFGVLYAAHELGLRVPEDIAVFGFDGTRNCRVSIPPLSTVQHPTTAIAARIVELLAGTAAPVHEILPYTLVLRRSCGCHDSVG